MSIARDMLIRALDQAVGNRQGRAWEDCEAVVRELDIYLAEKASVEEKDIRRGSHIPAEPSADATRLNSCGTCGCALVSIRGRHPGCANRIVCPTCLADRVDIAVDTLRPPPPMRAER